jgi:hypothetical protein
MVSKTTTATSGLSFGSASRFASAGSTSHWAPAHRHHTFNMHTVSKLKSKSGLGFGSASSLASAGSTSHLAPARWYQKQQQQQAV